MLDPLGLKEVSTAEFENAEENDVDLDGDRPCNSSLRSVPGL